MDRNERIDEESTLHDCPRCRGIGEGDWEGQVCPECRGRGWIDNRERDYSDYERRGNV